MRRMVLITLLAGALSFLVYPHALLSSKNTLPDDNDTRLIAYIIGQVQDNLLHFRNPYFGRFFAPYQNTLAYSDLFLTTAVITLPARLFTSSPVVIYNLAYSFGFVLTFVALLVLPTFFPGAALFLFLSRPHFSFGRIGFRSLPHLLCRFHFLSGEAQRLEKTFFLLPGFLPPLAALAVP